MRPCAFLPDGVDSKLDQAVPSPHLLERREENWIGLTQCSFSPPSEDIRRWQSYVEPGDELEGGGGDGEDAAQSPNKRISRNMELLESPGGGGGGPGGALLAAEDEEELLPLPEGTLARNLGLDLIVVITKVRTCRIISL